MAVLTEMYSKRVTVRLRSAALYVAPTDPE